MAIETGMKVAKHIETTVRDIHDIIDNILQLYSISIVLQRLLMDISKKKL